MKLIIIVYFASLFLSKGSNVHNDLKKLPLANAPRNAKKNQRLFTKSNAKKREGGDTT